MRMPNAVASHKGGCSTEEEKTPKRAVRAQSISNLVRRPEVKRPRTAAQSLADLTSSSLSSGQNSTRGQERPRAKNGLEKKHTPKGVAPFKLQTEVGNCSTKEKGSNEAVREQGIISKRRSDCTTKREETSSIENHSPSKFRKIPNVIPRISKECSDGFSSIATAKIQNHIGNQNTSSLTRKPATTLPLEIDFPYRNVCLIFISEGNCRNDSCRRRHVRNPQHKRIVQQYTSKLVCRFHPKCRRPGCMFRHDFNYTLKELGSFYQKGEIRIHRLPSSRRLPERDTEKCIETEFGQYGEIVDTRIRNSMSCHGEPYTYADVRFRTADAVVKVMKALKEKRLLLAGEKIFCSPKLKSLREFSKMHPPAMSSSKKLCEPTESRKRRVHNPDEKTSVVKKDQKMGRKIHLGAQIDGQKIRKQTVDETEKAQNSKLQIFEEAKKTIENLPDSEKIDLTREACISYGGGNKVVGCMLYRWTMNNLDSIGKTAEPLKQYPDLNFLPEKLQKRIKSIPSIELHTFTKADMVTLCGEAWRGYTLYARIHDGEKTEVELDPRPFTPGVTALDGLGISTPTLNDLKEMGSKECLMLERKDFEFILGDCIPAIRLYRRLHPTRVIQCRDPKGLTYQANHLGSEIGTE